MPEQTSPPAQHDEAVEKESSTQAPDTVRQRWKKNAKASAQRFIPIAEIRNDTVILKNGGLRAILEVESMNFNLKSEVEQQGIIAGYQSFINSITFPVQISIVSRRVNIDPYIQGIRKRAETQKNALLKKQSIDYSDFIQRIVDVADIMKKRFYIIIPLDDIPPHHTPFALLLRWLGIDDSESKAIQRYRYFMSKHVKLKERINLVESGMTSIGLMTRILTTQDLIELYYRTYNVETSHHQPLRGDAATNPLVL